MSIDVKTSKKSLDKWKFLSKNWPGVLLAEDSGFSISAILPIATLVSGFVVGYLVRKMSSEEESPSFTMVDSEGETVEDPEAPPSPTIPGTGHKHKSKSFTAPSRNAVLGRADPNPTYDTSGYTPAYAVPKLGAGYRQKVQFTGFQGSEPMSAYGSYTEDEAKRIVELKKAGSHTGWSTGMDPEIRDYIIDSAYRHGVDPSLALQIAKVESGGNPNAISSTGAIGVFQFTGGTATDFGLRDRFNAKDNIDAGMRLLRSREGAIPISKRSSVASYLTLQLGAGGARELLSVPADTPISSLSGPLQDAISKNVGRGSATTGEYIEANAKALAAKVGSVSNLLAESPAYKKPGSATSGSSTSTPSSPTAPIPAPQPSAPSIDRVVKVQGKTVALH